MLDQAASLRQTYEKSVYPPCVAFVGPARSGISTLVGEFALALWRAGQRVLVANFNDQHMLARRLNVEPPLALRHALAGLADVLAAPQPGLALLNLQASPLERLHLPLMLWQRLSRECAALERDSTLILMDIPNLDVDPTPVRIADTIILVLVPTEDSLKRAYLQVKQLVAHHGVHHINVVVNRARHLNEAQDLFTRLTNATSQFLPVSMRWMGFIPSDNAIRRRLILGRTVPIDSVDSPATEAFAQFAQTLSHWWESGHFSRQSNGLMDRLWIASRDDADYYGVA